MSITESSSGYDHLEHMSVRDLLMNISREDQTVALAVAKAVDQIEAAVKAALARMEGGGRLFYIGAGTSGRLGIVDASEIPPTYGMPQGIVIGLIAGGDTAIRKSVEHAEDDAEQGWKDLLQYNINDRDFLVGIAASGRTPYVVGALEQARRHGIATCCITCNLDTAVAGQADYPIEVIVGPEFVTGSTRMKSGTAQKLVLNMISTALMVKLGRVRGNKMVDMQTANDKLIGRAVRMIMEELGTSYEESEILLKQFGTVRKAIDSRKG